MMTDGVLLLGIPYYVGDLLTSVMLIVSLLISMLNSVGSVKRIKVVSISDKGSVA
jgi:hypothetical protein